MVQKQTQQCVCGGGVKLLSIKDEWSVVRSEFNVRWKALIFGNLLDTLNIIISPIEKFLKPPEVKKCAEN